MKEVAINTYKGCQKVIGNLELTWVISYEYLQDINDAIKVNISLSIILNLSRIYTNAMWFAIYGDIVSISM